MINTVTIGGALLSKSDSLTLLGFVTFPQVAVLNRKPFQYGEN